MGRSITTVKTLERDGGKTSEAQWANPEAPSFKIHGGSVPPAMPILNNESDSSRGIAYPRIVPGFMRSAGLHISA